MTMVRLIFWTGERRPCDLGDLGDSVMLQKLAMAQLRPNTPACYDCMMASVGVGKAASLTCLLCQR